MMTRGEVTHLGTPARSPGLTILVFVNVTRIDVPPTHYDTMLLLLRWAVPELIAKNYTDESSWDLNVHVTAQVVW